MAKKQFLDETGLSAFLDGVKGLIPQLVEGDNITLTPDEEKPNKITISSAGGGITLPEVSGASVTALSRKSVLTWADPADLLVGDTPIAEWGGTLVIRKEGSAPTSYKDGVTVIDSKTKNQYVSEGLEDTGLTNDTIYYYGFFTYTKDKKYSGGVFIKAVPERYVIASEPTTSIGAFTYDGTEQGPVWSNYDSSKMTLTGDKATNAGSYVAKFTPLIDYKWADGSIEAKEVNWIINRAVIPYPTQKGTLVYDGEAKNPEFNNLDYSVCDALYEDSINAGTYDLTVTPDDNHCWEDGSFGSKNFPWVISRATPTFSLDKTSVTLNNDNLSDTVTITTNSDGVISVTSNATSIVTASVSDNVITIDNVGKTSGSATITISVAEGMNYNAVTGNISVTASFLKIVPFSTGTWEEISDMLDAHYAGEIDIADYWSVGDTKTGISFSGVDAQNIEWTVSPTKQPTEVQPAQSIDLVIVGIKHDDLISGGKAAITLSQKNCLNNKGFMSHTASTTIHTSSFSRWSDSMRRTWMEFYKAALPTNLQSLIKNVEKESVYPTNINNINGISSTSERCFLFSNWEIQGRAYSDKVTSPDGTQYEYFKTASNRQKNVGSDPSVWWTRSGYFVKSPGNVGSENKACFATTIPTGSYGGYTFTSSAGICPGFCL